MELKAINEQESLILIGRLHTLINFVTQYK